MDQFTSLSESKKRELVNKAYRLGYEYVQKYGNCTQCVIAAIQDVFGCIDDAVFKSGCALAAGYGLTSRATCGALNGAGMVISSLQGRERENFASGRYGRCYSQAKEMMNRFIEEYGSCLCFEVQQKLFDGKSYDLSIREEFIEFEAAGGHRDKCPAVVGAVAQWVAELIVENKI
jgi:hypothetical protein